MTTITDFNAHVAAMLEKDEKLILGRLVWFSVTDVLIPHDDVVKLLLLHDIQLTMPKPPAPSDVFRRVCSKAERKKEPVLDPVGVPVENMFENFMVRDLKYDGDNVFRRIVGERVDSKGKRLAYEQLIDLTFNKSNETIAVRQIGPSLNGFEKALVIAEEIKKRYAEEAGKLNSNAIRDFLRTYLLEIGAIPVRSGGGVYFVPEEKVEKLLKLDGFACAITSGNVDFHHLPLLDEGKQRDMLRAAYDDATIGEVTTLIEEIAEIKSKQVKISKKRYHDLVSRYHTLLDRSKDYSELLEDSLNTSRSRLDVLMQQVISLNANNVNF